MRKYVLFAVLVFVSGSNEMFGSARDLHPLASYPQRAAAAVLSFTHCLGVCGGLFASDTKGLYQTFTGSQNEIPVSMSNFLST